MKRRILSFVLVLVLLSISTIVFVGCGSLDVSSHELVGSWSGETEIHFFEDGTGWRGIPSDNFTFTWSVRSNNRLTIRLDESPGRDYIRNEQWTYTFENGRLSLESRQTNDRFRNLMSIDMGAGDDITDHPLLGTWSYNDMPSWQYLFRADGSGVRGIDEEAVEFRWSVIDSTLIISCSELAFGVTYELWTTSFSGDVLTLRSQQATQLVFRYTFVE